MKKEIWIFLFALGVLFFNWPLISIFRENLVIALFVIWFVLILLVFITSIFSGREDGN